MDYPAEFEWLAATSQAGLPCKIRCPHCFQKLDLSLFPAFSQTDCPACGTAITVPVLFAGFELYQLLSEGRRTRIYRARDGILQRDIALKICKDPEYNEYYRESFSRLAMLAHPGVLWVYTAGDFGDFTYGALQLMEQGSVQHGTWRESLGLGKLLANLIPVVHALTLAAEHHIVHHDICPANLLCSAEGSLRLTNFRPGEGEWPLPSDHWNYRSPEALSAQHFDGSGDLYSMALTIYELLSGVYPFGELRDVNTLLDRQNKPVQSLHELNALISPALADTVARGLSPDPGRRPGVAELQTHLRRALAELLEHYK